MASHNAHKAWLASQLGRADADPGWYATDGQRIAWVGDWTLGEKAAATALAAKSLEGHFLLWFCPACNDAGLPGGAKYHLQQEAHARAMAARVAQRLSRLRDASMVRDCFGRPRARAWRHAS